MGDDGGVTDTTEHGSAPAGSAPPPEPLRPPDPTPAPRRSAAEEARTLVAGANQGVLASLTADGAPWGSVVTYGALADGAPVLLVSTMAEHARNLLGDPRASLVAAEPPNDENPLDRGRVTLAGRVHEPTGDAREAARTAHLAAMPSAELYVDFADFRLFVLGVERVRWVGGYGRMDSASAEDYARAEPDPVAPSADGADRAPQRGPRRRAAGDRAGRGGVHRRDGGAGPADRPVRARPRRRHTARTGLAAGGVERADRQRRRSARRVGRAHPAGAHRAGRDVRMTPVPPPRVIIIGAGFGGIGAAIELQRHGFRDVTILDAAPELGGTWFHNTYPGAACDVPSHLYSYSFAQRRDWARLCPTQADILTYLRGVARDFGVDQLVRTDTRVTACRFSDAECLWRVETEDGETLEAEAVVIATGQLHQPTQPSIPGAEQFEGHTFHSARWDHEYPLEGKRVAVVGTGASAVQFVPEIAKEVGKLTVFQRSGNWFMPRKNHPYPAAFRWAVQHLPGLQAYRRRFIYNYGEGLTAAIRHPRTVGRFVHLRSKAFMKAQLKDPEVRAKAWPDYTFGCKRVLFSSYFLPALQRPNVELVTDPVAGMVPEGVVTADGTLHEVDCVIWGTGFKTTQFMFPMEITGSEGRDLREQWAGGPHAHLGITVPGFPSLFVMYGPNTNTSGGSIITYLEAQAGYLRQALQEVRARGAGAIEVRPEVEAASDRALQERFGGTAWTQCDSWYRDASGRIVTNWPGYMRQYVTATKRLDPAEYTLPPGAGAGARPGLSAARAGGAFGSEPAERARIRTATRVAQATRPRRAAMTSLRRRETRARPARAP